jgi:hypothetical protein
MTPDRASEIVRRMEITRQRRQLVDEAMDAYVAWREECIAVSEAYQRWAAASEADAAVAFESYGVALVREELACEVYAALIRRGDAGAEFHRDHDARAWSETGRVAAPR